MDQPTSVDASFYAIIVPEWHTSIYCRDGKGRPILKGAHVERITKTKPRVLPKQGAILTRLTLRIDAEALLPLVPEAVIHINAGNAEIIEVTADAPEEAGEAGE